MKNKNNMKEIKNTWLFSAYKNEEDYENNNPFFEKTFSDFNKMKTFSAKHSYVNKDKYPEYCSDYIKNKY